MLRHDISVFKIALLSVFSYGSRKTSILSQWCNRKLRFIISSNLFIINIKRKQKAFISSFFYYGTILSSHLKHDKKLAHEVITIIFIILNDTIQTVYPPSFIIHRKYKPASYFSYAWTKIFRERFPAFHAGQWYK